MQTFNFSVDETQDDLGTKAKLTFSGYLTLQNAKEIRITLQNQFSDFDTIEVMARDVSGIDVSFLQIVESYRKTHEQEGRKVKVLMDLPYDLKSLLANAGITYPVK